MSRVAVIDMGSNSTRLLVAEVSGGTVHELARETRITRLAQGVDSTGYLAVEAVDRVLAALADYREAIDGLGATQVTAVATSAVRESRKPPTRKFHAACTPRPARPRAWRSTPGVLR